jgi:predicted dehydrogenase
MAKNFPIVQVVACADLDMEKARAKAAEYGVPKVLGVDQLLESPEIDLVMNLTVPRAHVATALRAVENGKHTYSEKPLGVDRAEGMKLLEAAKKKNVLVGCAPDTFMGSGIQTARKLLDEGIIGRPVAFTAMMMCPGHEHWHPSPEFYYQAGGGPMFDMGPYYLTALLNLLGPVKRISGMASVAISLRTITSRDKYGQTIVVQTPDHVCGMLEFQNGAVGSLITSFATRFPTYDWQQPITIYGTEGTMRVIDPNTFDGPVHYRRKDDADWVEAPPQFVTGYGRSVGVADMAFALQGGRAHRASGSQAMAVLDLMRGFLDSSESGRSYEPVTSYERPAPMPAGLPFGVLDL